MEELKEVYDSSENTVTNSMMSSPLVSVIIPNYCHARYLDQRIQSVLNQTYQNYEVIILDDCSPDNGESKAVIEKYRGNKHVSKIVYNEKNSGSPFKQWEKGISLAEGELIWIAESDDKCLPTLLEKLVCKFEKNAKLVLAFCKTVAFTDDGQEKQLDPLPLTEDTVFNSKDFISKYMVHGCPMLNASACLFKKDVAFKIANLYCDFKGAGDRMFWTEISECGNVAVVNEWLNLMRFHLNNSTKKFNSDGTNQKEDKKILDYILNNGYITSKAYKHLRHDYVKVHIFEMLTDKQLQQKLYSYWGFTKWNLFCLKLEVWSAKILRLFTI